MSNRKSDKKVKVEKVAWFMANFQCVDLDDSSFERIRELLSHCRGSKTRVALSKVDGWKSGKNSLLHKHKKKKVPLSCIHNLIQDEKFINVLLCVFAVQVAESDDPSQWTSTSSAAAPQRRYISSSANDLTSAGVFYGHQQQHPGPRGNGEPPRRQPSSTGRTLPSDDGSVVFSDTDTDGVAIARVNGVPRAGSLSPEFDDVDNTTPPIHLVYARPPSTSADHRHYQQQQQFNYSTSRKDRYHSTDGVSLVQPGDVRSPPVGGRYYLTSSRSEICSVSGAGSRVVPASRVVYRPSATLINPRFNKNKQYMPRSSGVVGSRAATSYRAVPPRSRAGSDWR